jgi:hypothetical protein
VWCGGVVSNISLTASSNMDATKKSASQLKREASQAKREYGKRKSEGGAANSGQKRPRHSHDSSSGSRNNKKPKISSGNHSSTSKEAGWAGGRSDNFAPKQKKKIDKPKHLKRKLQQAETEANAETDAEKELAQAKMKAIQEQQRVLEEKKGEAKDKFYQLCRTLVGEDKWNDEKQATYDQLVKEKGERV